MARAPDIVRLRREYIGGDATALAGLLELTDAGVTFEPAGFTGERAAGHDDRAYGATIQWHAGAIALDGRLADRTTGSGHGVMPRYELASPVLAHDELESSPGWGALARKLAAVPATTGPLGEAHTLEVALSGERIVVSLVRLRWSPAPRYRLFVELGPQIDLGPPPSDDLD